MKSIKATPRPDPTRNERQARIREARKKWLNEHGFTSMEGMMGALMKGEYFIVKRDLRDVARLKDKIEEMENK